MLKYLYNLFYNNDYEEVEALRAKWKRERLNLLELTEENLDNHNRNYRDSNRNFNNKRNA